MSEIVFGCPHCGQSLQCDSEFAGQTVACPNCQGGIILPSETPVAAETPVETAQAPDEVMQETAPAPAPEPEPTPEPTPEPAPEPEAEPQAEATPEPEPTPAPEPEQAAETTPEPEVATEPAPAAEPSPAPRKQPQFGAKKKITTNQKFPIRKPGMTQKPLSSATSKPAPKPTPKPAAEKETPAAAELAPGEIPAEAKGWSWAALLWGPIWAIGNKVWSGLLTLLPGIGIIFIFILAATGKKKAWAKGKWRDVDHFVKVQRRWVKVWLILFIINIIAIVALFILGPGAALLSMAKGDGLTGNIVIEDTSFEGMDQPSNSDSGTPLKMESDEPVKVDSDEPIIIDSDTPAVTDPDTTSVIESDTPAVIDSEPIVPTDDAPALKIDTEQ